MKVRYIIKKKYLLLKTYIKETWNIIWDSNKGNIKKKNLMRIDWTRSCVSILLMSFSLGTCKFFFANNIIKSSWIIYFLLKIIER